MEKKNVVIHIAGSEYTILTEEDPAYVEALAETLDKDITEIVGANRRLSMTQAAILAALDYADKAAKDGGRRQPSRSDQRVPEDSPVTNGSEAARRRRTSAEELKS